MRERERLVILGGGGHAAAIESWLRDQSGFEPSFEILGFCAPHPDPRLAGLAYLGPDHVLPDLRATAAVAAIGEPAHRARVVAQARAFVPNLRFPVFTHPSAWIASNAKLAPGTLVFPGARVGARARLGAFSLVNTGAILEHDAILGDFASLAPGAVAGGDVAIGARCAIGLAAILRDGIRIGDETIVGAGSLVLGDLPGYCVAYGHPAKIARPLDASQAPKTE